MKKIAMHMLREAELRLKTARRAFKEKAWAYCIRQAQECVELSLKAILRLKGIEYPKEHDVGEVLRAEAERYPPWFKSKVDYFADISAKLAEQRIPAMYGSEEEGLTPIELFEKRDAEEALKGAVAVFQHCKRLVEGQRER